MRNLSEFATRVTPTRIACKVWSPLCYKSIGFSPRPPRGTREAPRGTRGPAIHLFLAINTDESNCYHMTFEQPMGAGDWSSDQQLCNNGFYRTKQTLLILTHSIPTRNGSNFKFSRFCIDFAKWIFIAHSTIVRPKILQFNWIQNENRFNLPIHCTAIISVPLIQELLALFLKLAFHLNFWPLVYCFWFWVLDNLYWFYKKHTICTNIRLIYWIFTLTATSTFILIIFMINRIGRQCWHRVEWSLVKLT